MAIARLQEVSEVGCYFCPFSLSLKEKARGSDQVENLPPWKSRFFGYGWSKLYASTTFYSRFLWTMLLHVLEMKTVNVLTDSLWNIYSIIWRNQSIHLSFITVYPWYAIIGRATAEHCKVILALPQSNRELLHLLLCLIKSDLCALVIELLTRFEML